MDYFYMNNDLWTVRFVSPTDQVLIDRTGKRTVATTDTSSMSVCISDGIYGDFLITVILHELGHCALHSFNLIDDLHRMVREEYWIDAEGWACNLIADFGFAIFSRCFDILGYDAWQCIPYELSKLVA